MRPTSTSGWLRSLTALGIACAISPHAAGRQTPPAPPPLESLAPGHITTIAGGGLSEGNDSSAESASFDGPTGIAVDSKGNIYVVDRNHHRIRKVDPAGIVTTIAGNGREGFSGDNGPAASASLRNPEDVAVDTAGNVYVADGVNYRVRKIDTNTGIITSIAGGGSDPGDGGLAVRANLGYPKAVAVDARGNVFIADWGTQMAVRRVDAKTGIITKVAGNGSQELSGDGGPAVSAGMIPSDIAVDTKGNLYIADRLQRIRVVAAATGVIRTLVQTDVDQPNGPYGLTLDADGSVLFADSNRIRKVTVATGEVITIAGTGEPRSSGDGGPALAARILPFGLAVNTAGDILFTEQATHKVRKVSADRTVVAITGAGRPADEGQPAIEANLSEPVSLAVDSGGNIYVGLTKSSSGSQPWTDGQVRRIDAATRTITTLYRTPAGNSFEPHSLAVDGDGNLIVADRLSRVYRLSQAGILTTIAGTAEFGFSGDGGPATAAMLSFPVSVAIDPDGNILVAEYSNHRVRKIDAKTGVITTVAGNGRSEYPSVPVDPVGDGGPATAAVLNSPNAVAVDSRGNMIISEMQTGHIRRVDRQTGIISTIARNARTYSLAVNDRDEVFVGHDRGRIYKLDLSNDKLIAVAGNGQAGVSGDGAPAHEAQFHYPFSLTFDRAGNLYFVDKENNRVRAIRAPIP